MNEIQLSLDHLDGTYEKIKACSSTVMRYVTSNHVEALVGMLKAQMSIFTTQPVSKRIALLYLCNDLLHAWLSAEDRMRLSSVSPTPISQHLVPFLPVMVKTATIDATQSELKQLQDLIQLWKSRGFLGPLPLDQLFVKLAADQSIRPELPESHFRYNHAQYDHESFDPILVAWLGQEQPVRGVAGGRRPHCSYWEKYFFVQANPHQLARELPPVSAASLAKVDDATDQLMASLEMDGIIRRR